MVRLEGLDHVALTVRDVEKSAAWYQETLGLSRLHQEVWGSSPAVVGIGSTSLALFAVQSETPDGPPGPEMICARHIAFRVNRQGFEEARAELSAKGIELEFEDHEIARSMYLRDPDGHKLEITTYEV